MSSFSRFTVFSVVGVLLGLIVWAVRSIVRLPFNVAAALNDGIDDRHVDAMRDR